MLQYMYMHVQVIEPIIQLIVHESQEEVKKITSLSPLRSILRILR
jgi:hypothetical protein